MASFIQRIKTGKTVKTAKNTETARRRKTGIPLVFSCCVISASYIIGSGLGGGLLASPWQPSSQEFLGPNNALIWKASFPAASESGQKEADFPPYKVVRAYENARLKRAHPPGAIMLRSAPVSLSESRKGRLSLWRKRIVSQEAVENPPLRYEYVFLLRIGERLRIARSHIVVLRRKGKLAPPSNPERDLRRLRDPRARRLARAVLHEDAPGMENSRMVQLAVRLLTGDHPLGPVARDIIFQGMRAQVNARTRTVKMEENSYGILQIRLPARTRDRVLLLPRFLLRERIAYSNRIAVRQKPLPSFSFIKLQRLDGAILSFGAAGRTPGEFQLGPVLLKDERKLKLIASYSLEPPGRKPETHGEILLRYGRKKEYFLDRGKTPPAPAPVPGAGKQELIRLTIRTVKAAFNPDIGEIRGLGYSRIVDLYAYAHERLKSHRDLQTAFKVALFHENARNSWTYLGLQLSRGSGWLKKDAQRVLEYPVLASSFAERLRNQPEPMRWTTRAGSPYPRKVPDLISRSPHALAAAALCREMKYTRTVQKQLSLLIRTHRVKNSREWPLKDLIETGQALKYVAARAKHPRVREIARRLRNSLQAQARARYLNKHAQLKLREKVDIAHLLSSVWRPYLNTPPFLLAKNRDIEPINDKRDIAGDSRLEARLRFKAALRRILREFKPLKISRLEKKKRLTGFIKRWNAYLIKVYRGKLPDTIKKELEEERSMALRGLGAP